MRPVLFGLGKASQQTNQSQAFTRKPSGTAVPGAEWKNLAPTSGPQFEQTVPIAKHGARHAGHSIPGPDSSRSQPPDDGSTAPHGRQNFEDEDQTKEWRLKRQSYSCFPEALFCSLICSYNEVSRWRFP